MCVNKDWEHWLGELKLNIKQEAGKYKSLSLSADHLWHKVPYIAQCIVWTSSMRSLHKGPMDEDNWGSVECGSWGCTWEGTVMGDK